MKVINPHAGERPCRSIAH